MIFVSVGTHYQTFDRLIKPMDKLAATIDEEVVIQCGASTYQPQYASHFQWTSSTHMEQLVEAASVVVAHAAAGISILVLRSSTPLVVVPRLKQLNEMVDDHQEQLAAALAAAGKATLVTKPSVETLKQAIAAAQPPDLDAGGSGRVVQTVRRTAVLQAVRRTALVAALREQLQIWRL